LFCERWQLDLMVMLLHINEVILHQCGLVLRWVTRRVQTPGYIRYQKNIVFWKTHKKSAPNLIQFQLVMPVIIKVFFMIKASTDQKVMNLQISTYDKLLVKLNKNLADD